MSTLPPEVARMVLKELDMPNFDALKDEWNTMLKCFEEICWPWKQEPEDSADKEQGQVGFHEGDWPEHSHADHQDVRHKILVKLGVISVRIRPKKTLSSFTTKSVPLL